jgi:hypothetical protein
MARKPHSPLWYVILAMFLSSMLTGVAAYSLADRRSSDRDRLWCASLKTIVEGFRAPADTAPTERALNLADDLDVVRHGYGCPE